ncbi:MAG: LPS export ABC transporter periplasmic protein LptC [Thiobacillus sp.]|nr:LPS export ABC transporter periplasmic protein LptC [Thiobacillus sp.]
MIGRGSLWLPLVVLLVLAALSFWIERSVQIPANGRQADQSDPEGIMENFDALRTDLNGRPQYRLSAKKLRHYSSSKLTELESPHFVLLDSQTGTINARALEATVSADGSEVDLQGKVEVERAAQAGQSALTLRTARLIVFPERNVLRSPGPVVVQDATLNMRAGAMEYNADRRIIKLTGRVQARYISGRS